MSQYAMCPQCDEPFTRNSNELGTCDRCVDARVEACRLFLGGVTSEVLVREAR